MTQIIFESKSEALVDQSAGLLLEALAAVRQRSGRVTVAFPGGRSVVELLRFLSLVDADWSEVHFFMIDERLVPLDSDDSNFKQLKDILLTKLLAAGKLADQQIYPFRTEQGIAAYEKTLKQHGGRYDILVLGAGEDGHVGALYSRHHSIQDPSDYFITMNDSPKPPPGRMSSSRKLLSRAEYAFAFLLGEAKRQAYQNYLNTKLSIEDCPLKLINDIPHSYLFTDLD